jgi:hypothetical protein
MQNHFKRYLVSTVVPFWEGGIGFAPSQKSHGGGYFDAKRHLLLISQRSASCPAPECIQVRPADTGQQEGALRVARGRGLPPYFSENTKITFKRDQKVVAVLALHEIVWRSVLVSPSQLQLLLK